MVVTFWLGRPKPQHLSVGGQWRQGAVLSHGSVFLQSIVGKRSGRGFLVLPAARGGALGPASSRGNDAPCGRGAPTAWPPAAEPSQRGLEETRPISLLFKACFPPPSSQPLETPERGLDCEAACTPALLATGADPPPLEPRVIHCCISSPPTPREG